MKHRIASTRQKAFSVGEVILAMFILAVGLVSVMALISKSLAYAQDSRDLIVAAELAQEGVELVRNVRDNSFAEGNGNDGFGRFDSDKYCYIDYRNNGNTLDCDPTVAAASRYYLQYQGGFYGHFNTTARERFSRYIYVDYSSTNHDVLVRSFVFWNNTQFLPASGSPTGCTALNSCVFTEVYLTAWK